MGNSNENEGKSLPRESDTGAVAQKGRQAPPQESSESPGQCPEQLHWQPCVGQGLDWRPQRSLHSMVLLCCIVGKRKELTLKHPLDVTGRLDCHVLLT